jgi:hypothetical protein
VNPATGAKNEARLHRGCGDRRALGDRDRSIVTTHAHPNLGWIRVVREVGQFRPQDATVEQILAAAPAYAEWLGTLSALDDRVSTIRKARETLYATLAYLMANEAKGVPIAASQRIKPAPREKSPTV